MFRVARSILASAVIVLLVSACGDSGSSTAPPQVSVSITPTSTSLAQGATATFNASVANAGNSGVNWTTTGGQISAQGNSATLTAPNSAGTVTVTATSVEDPTRSASATVNVAEVAVSIAAPETAAVRLGQLTLSASVTGTVNTGVSWTSGCDNFVADGASATWTAPGGITTCQATATSAADGSKSASVELTVRPEFFVNTTDDTSDGVCSPAHCSLREALTLARAEVVAGADSAKVRFTAAVEGGTITLGSNLPVLDRNISIVGPGSELLTLNANGSVAEARRHFVIISGPRVSIEGMTLTGGNASGPGGLLNTAGSIWATEAAHLRLRDVALTGNRAAALAGAIRLEEGTTARIESSRISGNEAGTSGGALVASTGSEVIILDSEVTGNMAQGIGGAIWLSSASAELYDTRLDDNTATGSGGGVYALGDARLYVQGGSISGNQSGGAGGGAATGDNAVVEMAGVVLAGNEAQATGGALFIGTSSLRLHDTEVVGNRSVTNAGGGIYFSQATAEITDGVFRENTSGQNGGGIALFFTSELRLENVDLIGNRTPSEGNFSGGGIALGSNSTVEYHGGRVHDNEAATQGGGIFVAFTDAHLSGLDVSGNRAGTFGGGISQTGSGSVLIEASTVRGNEATLGGGGLTLQSTTGNLLVRNVTVSGNRAPNGAALRVGALGRLENVTVVGNIAEPTDPTLGGALFWLTNTNGFEVTNLLLAGNLTDGEARNCAIPPGAAVVINSLGGNLSSDQSCTAWVNASGTPDLNGTTPGVDMALADHGGPTLTHALLEGSAAVGAGNAAHCPTTDQRGFTRGAACDIGAFQKDGTAAAGAFGRAPARR